MQFSEIKANNVAAHSQLPVTAADVSEGLPRLLIRNPVIEPACHVF